jgi:Eco47II restriction endonuclease
MEAPIIPSSLSGKPFKAVCRAAATQEPLDELSNTLAAVKLAPSPHPSWYNLPEIPFEAFVKCCEPIYKVLEETHKSKSFEDLFTKIIYTSHYNLSDEEWYEEERKRLLLHALRMKMGDFHEELMGKFEGYETLKVGHSSTCDIRSKDDSILIEVKNRSNTEKGSNAKYLIQRLEAHAKKGKRAILVQVNCKNGKVNRYNASSSVDVWNGQQAYAFLSGRDDFLEDLEKLLRYVFKTYRTYDELIKVNSPSETA